MDQNEIRSQVIAELICDGVAMGVDSFIDSIEDTISRATFFKEHNEVAVFDAMISEAISK